LFRIDFTLVGKRTSCEMKRAFFIGRGGALGPPAR
jgi:hypothetical protein